MPFNLAGSLSTLGALFNPRSIVPYLTVPDIRYLNWRLLWESGYRGIVFDRDNCLTRPHEDELIPELKDSFEECRKTFGPERLLMVSNSAGTPLDAGYLATEALERNLQIPVLKHDAMKPSRKCIISIKDYFESLRSRQQPNSTIDEKATLPTHESLPKTPPTSPRLVVIGDRVLTDVLMGNHRDMGSGNMTVLTQTVWAPEALGIRLLRAGETFLSGLISRQEEVKEHLKAFSRFAKSHDEVLGTKPEVATQKSGRETLWEGRS